MEVQPFDAKLQETKEHLLEYVTDHRHFTARWLTEIKEKVAPNLDEESIAKIIVNLFGLWMMVSSNAEFFTNFILVGLPFMLFILYPDEAASDADMLIYWPCLALVTLFDFLLEMLPGYYSLKLVLFAFFFLKPWRFVDKIRDLLLVVQLYRAAVGISHRVQEVTPDISQLLAAQDNGPSASRAQMPPLSLLAPQLVTANSKSSVSTAADDAEEMPPASTTTARSNDAAGNKQSQYVSLVPKSQTKLVNPQQSIYASNRQREEMKKQNDEKK